MTRRNPSWLAQVGGRDLHATQKYPGRLGLQVAQLQRGLPGIGCGMVGKKTSHYISVSLERANALKSMVSVSLGSLGEHQITLG